MAKDEEANAKMAEAYEVAVTAVRELADCAFHAGSLQVAKAALDAVEALVAAAEE